MEEERGKDAFLGISRLCSAHALSLPAIYEAYGGMGTSTTCIKNPRQEADQLC